jgi:flagellar basal-body rod protein FlgF
MDIPSTVAASRLVAQQRVMEVVAVNIANVNKPGFKAQRVQFSDWLAPLKGTDAPRGDRTIAYTQDRATWREQRAGTLTHTGNPFDLGITGDGYCTVRTPQGPRLTRDGRFGLMPDGTVANSAGMRC